jgi:polysaccharide biosynthesis protein PslJ
MTWYGGSAATVPLRPRVRETATTSPWPLYFIFLALPLWWALGAIYFIWPLLTFPLLLSLLAGGRIVFPRRFGVWLLFLAWLPLSVVQLHNGLSYALFAYRASLFFSATILFLYVFNASRDQISTTVGLNILALFWVEVIVGGFLGVLFPTISFHTPTESLVPRAFLDDQTAYNFIHPAFADVVTFFGHSVGRPKVLFGYTNQWGACVAVLTPFALAAYSRLRRGALRRSCGVLLILSVIPIALSLNRGLWLGLAAGLGYVGVRFARMKHFRALFAGAVVLAVCAVVVAATPLGNFVVDRLTTEQTSTGTRLSTYDETIARVKESPLIGYGSPGATDTSRAYSNLGTHGQLFTVVYSYGIPALAFFVGWFAYTFLRAARRRTYACLWASAAVFVALVEIPYYNLMPTTIHVVMVAAALAWRDIVRPEGTEVAE